MLNMKKTLTKILNAIQGIETRTLLWTNPSPTSNFAAQTITLDLTEYDYIVVAARVSKTANGADEFRIENFVGNSGKVFFNYNTRQVRAFEITSNGIAFENGYSGNYNAMVSANSADAIPVKIYGIKTL